jgi:hypothetical protein
VAGNRHQPNTRVFERHRQRVLKRVGDAVDSWIDGGFVGVAYPRNRFPVAFSAFTKPAEQEARHQQRLMTNWTLRKEIDGVDVKERTIVVDVLAPHGRPAGATARVRLVFTTTGHRDKRVHVHGQLYLVPVGNGSWRIFGYDVSQGGSR